MRFGGLELNIGSIGVEKGDLTIFFPFPKIRRYELMEVRSCKDAQGGIKHDIKVKYQVRTHPDPVSHKLSREVIKYHLIDFNTNDLKKTGEKEIVSKEIIYKN
jgi:hypothetical protein